MKISLFTLFTLLVLPRAFAEGSAGTYPLDPMPKAECVSALETVLNPEAAVEKGLDALESMNGPKVSLDSCFAEMFNGWTSKFPVKQAPAAVAATKYQQALNELGQQLQCYNPYADAGYGQQYIDQYKQQYDSACAGKWLSKEERNGLQEKKNKLELANFLLAAIPGAFRDGFDEDRKKLQQERYKTYYCTANPYQAGSYGYTDFQNNYEAHCSGQQLTPEEMAAQQALVNKLQQELNQKTAENAQLVNKLTQIFNGGYSYPPDVIFEKADTLLPLATILVCTSPYPENSPGYQNWKWGNWVYCQGKAGDPDGVASARAKFLGALGNPDEIKAKVDKERAATQEKMKLLNEAAARLQYHSYGYHRLYGYFRKHLQNGGGTEDLNEFCTKYEASLEREKKFFETSLKQGYRVDFQDFDSTDWMPFEKYGLTEAESGILRAYIGNFYAPLNSSLYNGDITPEAQIYREMLNSALDKIPAYQGEPTIRYSTLPEKFLDQHRVGEVITYESFTSTSKKKNWNWQNGGNARFLIYNGHSGKDVAADFNQGEQEVIFKAGTRFKVIAKEKNGSSTNFVLVEVDDKDAPMASVKPAGENAP